MKNPYFFQKTIKTGDYLEIYEYENAPPVTAPRRRKPKSASVSETPEFGGLSPAPERRFDNIQRLKKSLIRLVRANLTGEINPAFLTLTFAAVADISTGNKAFAVFAKWLSEKFGSSIRYISVPEFQERGSVHYHVLVWGLPSDVINEEKYTRFLQRAWGYGYVDVIHTDGSPALAFYVAKYMQKALHDVRLSGKRAYNASRNCLRPVSWKNTQILSNALELFGAVDNETLQTHEFHSKWLGKARYRLIRLVT